LQVRDGDGPLSGPVAEDLRHGTRRVSKRLERGTPPKTAKAETWPSRDTLPSSRPGRLDPLGRTCPVK
jgi:hypothetical protein